MKNLKLVAILGALFLAGCSIDASIQNLTGGNSSTPVISFEKAGGAEFVSGALPKYETTPILNYKVQASVGHFIPNPRVKTATRGYYIYSSVQGSMLSEQ